jgi:hypothetical protein
MKIRHVSYNAEPVHFDDLTHETKEEIKTKLAQVARMLNGTGADWYLVGGLGIAMHNNKITRKHGGIDIEVDVSQIPKLREGMKEQGYHLGTKAFIIDNKYAKLLGYKKDVLVYTDFEEYADCEKNEQLMKLKDIRFVKEYPKNYSGTLDRLVDMIGVKVCKRTFDGAIISYEGKLIEMKKPYEGKIIELNGEEIKLRNIVYHRHLKNLSRKNGDETAIYDLLFISKDLPDRMRY